MTRDDIIRLAREVGGVENATVWLFDEIELERFAKLVAAAEREACADVCEGHYATEHAARAIRARGQE
jgi:hypothetical protein